MSDLSSALAELRSDLNVWPGLDHANREALYFLIKYGNRQKLVAGGTKKYAEFLRVSRKNHSDGGDDPESYAKLVKWVKTYQPAYNSCVDELNRYTALAKRIAKNAPFVAREAEKVDIASGALMRFAGELDNLDLDADRGKDRWGSDYDKLQWEANRDKRQRDAARAQRLLDEATDVVERLCLKRQVNPAQRVELRGRDQGPIVLTREKRKLTKAQYDVVQTALKAPDGGWTKDQLASESEHTDALGILHRLADKDRDWKKVIHFGGQTGGGYWIK